MLKLPTDLRDAVRALVHHPTFAVIAIATMAIGIGANTALFSVVNAVLLRPLPYRDAGRLAWVATTVPALRAEIVGGADYLEWRDGARSLQNIGAWDAAPSLTLLTPSEPERIAGARVSASVLPTLGIQPARGRSFTRDDERLGAPPVALLSDRLWQRLFGSAVTPSGQPVTLDTGTFAVVGVLPRGFVFPQVPDVDVLLPLRLDEARERGRQWMSILHVVARLAPGVTMEQARAELTSIRDRSESAAESRPPLDGPGGPMPRVVPGSAPGSAEDGDVMIAPGPGGGPPPPRAPGLSGAPADTFDVAVGPAAPAAEQRPFVNGPAAGPAGATGASPGASPGAPGMQGGPAPPPGGGPGQMRVELDGPPGPEPRGRPPTDVVVRPLHDELVGDVRPALLLLAVTVGLVLLIACANVANLALARASTRTRELAVRAALGASRWRLMRQLLAESLVVSFAGGAAGVVIAFWAVRGLLAAMPPEIADGWLGQVAVGIDPVVLTFTFAIATLTGLVAGLGPALMASRVDLHGSLKDAAPTSSGTPARSRMRRALVVAELGMAVVLLVGAGLLVRSFARLLSVDPGFRPDRVLTMAVDVSRGPDEAARQRSAAFFAQLAERARALPGVQSVAYGDTVPLRDYSMMIMGLEPEGRDEPSAGPPPEIAITVVSPDYFQTMGMRIVRGRAFGPADRRGAPPVAVVNESMARQFWGTADPIGRRLRVGPRHPDWITVVGVVGDVKHDGLAGDARRAMYRPFDQEPTPVGFVAVRTAGEPASLVAAMRHEVRALDASLVLYDVATMDQRIAASIVGRRFSMLLLGGFALIALVLAALGLYGVLTSAVADRTREIGIRMALGARAADVLRLVMRQSIGMVAFGLVLGIAGALATGPLLAGALFAVSARDPSTLVAVPVLLALVALMAAWVPARRATRVDPVVALREE